MKKIKNHGFTLSEVLITLAIIGIVAAITVPTIMANYTKQAKSAKLKKAASVVSQACKKALADNGTGDIRNTDLYQAISYSVSEEATQILGKYFSIVGNAKKGTRDFPFQNSDFGTSNYFSLADGTAISLIDSRSINDNAALTFIVDIDGLLKGYNLVGEDVFGIPLTYYCSLDTDGYTLANVNLSDYTIEEICNSGGGYGSHADFAEDCFRKIVSTDWNFDYRRNKSGFINKPLF